MFVGEGPGFHEDQQARPFVGPAGKLLDELLASAGLRRSDVYITNVVKCRPPNNRDPLPAEIEACRMHGHLRRQNGMHYLHMYHPAAALHAGNLRKTIEDDFRRIPQALQKVRQAEQPVAVAEPAPDQMRLF